MKGPFRNTIRTRQLDRVWNDIAFSKNFGKTSLWSIDSRLDGREAGIEQEQITDGIFNQIDEVIGELGKALRDEKY